jgi:polyhydroxybutyrate depolymerase
VPLVFSFHGGGGDAEQAEKFTRFDPVSDREGFIVVYPDALNKNWNDGRNAQNIQSQREKVDDIGFVTALLARLTRDYNIDPRRVYATGPSNGGILSNRIGAELSDRFAAIAPVIGGMARPIAEKFRPTDPISVLMINGTEDPLVPYGGGQVTFLGRPRGEIIATSETIKKWVVHNRCNREPVVTDVPNKDTEDKTTSVAATYRDGRDDTEVILITIEGGGHTWPGGSQYLPVAMIGRVGRDFDGTALIWSFFKAHPKP